MKLLKFERYLNKRYSIKQLQTRRLAAANRSRVSIRGRPCKIFPHIYSLITMQTSAAVSHTMCAHVGSPRNWGTLGPAPLGFGAAETRYFPRVLAFQIYSLWL